MRRKSHVRFLEGKGAARLPTHSVQGMMRPMRILSLIALAVCAGCVNPVAGLFPPVAGQPFESVYVMRHGRHVGIILPTAPVPRDAWPEVDAIKAAYVELGWADRYYNMSHDAEWRRICAALFLPTASILKVIPISTHPTNYCTGNGLVQIDVSTQGFRLICAFVGETYARDPAGQPMLLDADTNLMIYAARGKYYFPKTSNAWTAKALRRAGCPIAPLRCATAGSTFFRARRCGVVIREDRTVAEQPLSPRDDKGKQVGP